MKKKNPEELGRICSHLPLGQKNAFREVVFREAQDCSKAKDDQLRVEETLLSQVENECRTRRANMASLEDTGFHHLMKSMVMTLLFTLACAGEFALSSWTFLKPLTRWRAGKGGKSRNWKESSQTD